ncbi:MAG: bifunctional folylpolyglutamate synthase/dihydrofolate synthase [Lachnospiraceae bacterium]|jgi:dihydrofolate synthase/folylpolyglutamate synthase|nr:bifunctional folylpolyglutamate synthase/dihydrofolate synthase [Lachnospiraceae bacterium]
MRTEYKEACDYIDELRKFTTKHSLSYTGECLEKLGRPDRKFRAVHVAGTNGKGSVCAFLASVLKEGGIRCGLFTSPHLVTMKERFRIDGEEITEEVFCSAFYRVRDISREMEKTAEGCPTYFEFLFLMGMVIFAGAGVQTAVLETGLGGRLDATNVIEYPYLCVITKISLDHMSILGDTIEKIAAEKAGIICTGVPVVYDGDVPGAAAVIEETAKKKHAPAFPVTSDKYKILKNSRSGIDFSITGSYDESAFLTVPSPAPYQVRNASLACFAARKLRETCPEKFSVLSEEVIASGIRKMVWEGRMEEVLRDVYIDGAHNADGTAEFIRAAKILSEGRKVDLLFAAVSDKEYAEMIRMLAEGLHPVRVTTASVEGSRKVDASELSFIFRSSGVKDVTSVPDMQKAFRHAVSGREDRMLFCIGSLYLAGSIKELLRSEKNDQL